LHHAYGQNNDQAHEGQMADIPGMGICHLPVHFDDYFITSFSKGVLVKH